MKKSPYLFLTLALALGSSCHSEANEEPTPAEQLEEIDQDGDVLMQANGSWEWVSTTKDVLNSSSSTPATVGFTRQLIFKADGKVYIHHNQKLVQQPAYGRRNGGDKFCDASYLRNWVVYAGETDPKISSTDARWYRITITKTDTTLTLGSEASCSDAGVHELYRWHHR
ncbi:hypothetical protein SAMN06265337_4260 [Hymenobacter gelipurpurascens]|uniref:Lipocalin-like domain-containing protein n=1 Tax=Hymenobacter gelipurpurascens TaxID=89968 RepID=A0A212UHK7_9BACT|nr:hypothetical protein SAMN06265337_4260 [Hymenobacter gelipurpurascens]